MARRLKLYKVFLDPCIDSDNRSITSSFSIKKKAWWGLTWETVDVCFGSRSNPLDLVDLLEDYKKNYYCKIDISEVRDYISDFFPLNLDFI